MTDHLVVLLSGEVAAEVRRTRSGALGLTYVDGKALSATPLSLSLPRGIAHVGATVEHFVTGLLPENDEALAAIARRFGADRRDPLSMLEAIGLDCPGAVQFCAADLLDDALARTGGVAAVTDSHIEARLAELDTDAAASWMMPGEHWSLPGTQQKFALRNEGGVWCEAYGSEPTTHIVKPGIRRARAQALAEHVTMTAARRLGVPTAITQFVEFKSESAIVIERFDRTRRDGAVVRLHQEDLCQALDIGEKYEDRGGPSAARIARLLSDSAARTSDAAANVSAFIDMVIFNTVVGAPDAHARNFAVMLDGDAVHLAPMFDSATALGHATTVVRMAAMSIGGEFELDRLTPRHWAAFAGDVGVDHEVVRDRVKYFAAEAPAAIASALDEVDHADAAELKTRLTEPLADLTAHMLASVGRAG